MTVDRWKFDKNEYMTEKQRDYIFLLEMLQNSEDTIFQKDCILSCMEHFFDSYRDAQLFAGLLTLFTDKFKMELQ